MDKKINGLQVSSILYEELRNYLLKRDKKINVVDVSVGNDFGGKMYAKMKKKKIQKETGIDFQSVHFENPNLEEFASYIELLNEDPKITGIMIQLPLSKELEPYEREILDRISAQKDIDGLTTTSIGRLALNEDTLIPCTPHGIETLLKTYEVPLKGKTVAIINRSNIVGKPLAHLMLRNHATPIICHSKTTELESITKNCDIVVAALNKQEYITSDFIKEGAIVIDVGVHKNKEKKTVGDVDFESVYPKASLITPPTGAVGPMTICMLAYNSAKSVYGKEVDEVLEQGISKAKTMIKTTRHM